MKPGRCTIILCLLLLSSHNVTGDSLNTSNSGIEPDAMSTGQILRLTVKVLADEIRSSVSGGQFSRVAVMPFTTLRGEENDLGLFISDRLTSELSVGEGSLQLVERSQIDQALAEMRLGETGFLSEETIQKTGEALGADAVIVGTIVEIGGEVDINLRVFSVSTLKILGKASQLIEKDKVIESMLSATASLKVGPGVSEDPDDESNSEIGNQSLLSGDVFFQEDFSGIEEGLFPEGWIGGSTLAVKPNDQERGGSILAPFKPDNHQFTIPNIQFPENWRFDLELVFEGDNRKICTFKIGEIKIGFHRGKLFINEIYTGKASPPKGQINLISVEKIGSVVKLFVNSEKMYVIRLESMEPPVGINFTTHRTFALHGLQGTKLP